MPEVYMFEDALEKACSTRLLANGINDTSKQQDNEGLKTPRVELKAIFNGPVVNRHWWINQSNGEKFLDLNEGRLQAKIVTRRGADGQDHSRLRGSVRWLMQDVKTISTYMNFHRIEEMIEASTNPSFAQDGYQDTSEILFDVKMSILFETKKAQIFLN